MFLAGAPKPNNLPSPGSIGSSLIHEPPSFLSSRLLHSSSRWDSVSNQSFPRKRQFCIDSFPHIAVDHDCVLLDCQVPTIVVLNPAAARSLNALTLWSLPGPRQLPMVIPSAANVFVPNRLINTIAIKKYRFIDLISWLAIAVG